MITPAPRASSPLPPLGWHEAILTFKRQLIERALAQAAGNRTHAARALGLQRTYLLRLMREFGIVDVGGGDVRVVAIPPAARSHDQFPKLQYEVGRGLRPRA